MPSAQPLLLRIVVPLLLCAASPGQAPASSAVAAAAAAAAEAEAAAEAALPVPSRNHAWPSRVVSWWYACDNNWPQAIAAINQSSRLSVVTSVQTYCGWDIAPNGTLVGQTSQACLSFFKELNRLGVHAELATGAGDCSMTSYRALWRDTTESPRKLLRAALEANVTGWNIDLEPQANGCKGPPIGTAADAELYASWLAAVRKVLSPHGIRLTADVASWSPVLSQFETLAPSVDRLQNMQTYQGNSLAQWTLSFDGFIKQAPITVAGIGLGAWNDTLGTSWWETRAGAEAKVRAAINAGVPELAVFRIVPGVWPLDFWWEVLLAFVER